MGARYKAAAEAGSAQQWDASRGNGAGERGRCEWMVECCDKCWVAGAPEWQELEVDWRSGERNGLRARRQFGVGSWRHCLALRVALCAPCAQRERFLGGGACTRQTGRWEVQVYPRRGQWAGVRVGGPGGGEGGAPKKADARRGLGCFISLAFGCRRMSKVAAWPCLLTRAPSLAQRSGCEVGGPLCSPHPIWYPGGWLRAH
jgi:hypothetical protein